MDCRIIVFMMILSPFPFPVSAGLFDILDERYIEDINELPPSLNLKPDIIWVPDHDWVKKNCKRDMSPKFVYGWIDIVGFEDLVRIDNTFYFNKSESSIAIIQYQTHSCVIGHRLFKGKWEHDLQTYRNGDQFVAKLTATQVLYSIVGMYYEYNNETRIFYDSEVVPLEYSSVMNPIVNIVEYNNPIEPKIGVIVTEPNASRIDIRINGNVATHTQIAYHIEQTPKGVYYANATPLESWNIYGNKMGRIQNSIIINANLSTFDYSDLNITVSDIFKTITVNKSEFNITKVTYEPEKVVFNPLLFGFIGIVITFVGASLYIIRGIQL